MLGWALQSLELGANRRFVVDTSGDSLDVKPIPTEDTSECFITHGMYSHTWMIGGLEAPSFCIGMTLKAVLLSNGVIINDEPLHETSD